MAGEAIEVQGADEIIRLLDRFPSMIERETADVNRRLVESEVQRIRVRARQTSRLAALASRSVRARGGRQPGISAGSGGGTPAAVFYGAEFGGRGRRTTQQFQPHLGGRGYFMFPQLRSDEDRIEEAATDSVAPAMKAWQS